jgi:N-acetyl-anhydromuramyl-L-alanine amidase AmpD
MRTLLFSVFVLAFFAGCATKEQPAAPIVQKADEKAKLQSVEMLATFGIEKWDGNRNVDTVVVHTAYSEDGEQYNPQNVYNIFKKYNVTPHYMIGRDGTIYKLADENDLAHHAGISRMKDGRESVNRFSIGVELINSKTDYPTRAQYISLAKLIQDIKTRYDIKYIVGHNEIAPTRKSDPWNFDFGILATMLSTDKHAKGETK